MIFLRLATGGYFSRQRVLVFQRFTKRQKRLGTEPLQSTLMLFHNKIDSPFGRVGLGAIDTMEEQKGKEKSVRDGVFSPEVTEHVQ